MSSNKHQFRKVTVADTEENREKFFSLKALNHARDLSPVGKGKISYMAKPNDSNKGKGKRKR